MVSGRPSCEYAIDGMGAPMLEAQAVSASKAAAARVDWMSMGFS